MSAPTIELTAEPALTLRTGRIALAALITLSAAVVTVALSIGAFKLGFESARAEIYEQQTDDLRALVGIVDQAKAREVASCAETGRADCLAVVGGAQ